MDYHKEEPLVMQFGDINALFREKFSSGALHKTEIVGVINNSACVSVFIVYFDFNAVRHIPSRL
jgi:hypothetical protein